MNKQIRFLILFMLIVVVDQLTKRWAISREIGQINLGFFLGFNLPHPNVIHVFGLICAGLVMYRLPVSILTKTMIIAGGFSNMLDRWFYGGIYDWLNMPIIGGYNNLADWYIVIGIGWSVVILVLKLNDAYFVRRQ